MDLVSYPIRADWDTTFMKICDIIKDRSVCVKYRTSAVVIKNTQIIGTGYNGTLTKMEECCERWENYWHMNNIKIPYAEWIKTVEFRNLHSQWSALNEIHAEVNALNCVSKNDIDDTCAIYVYYSPCDQCAKQILSYGIKNLYYYKVYPGKSGNSLNGIKFLIERGIKCTQISV